jgi:hypothetical protein
MFGWPYGNPGRPGWPGRIFVPFSPGPRPVPRVPGMAFRPPSSPPWPYPGPFPARTRPFHGVPYGPMTGRIPGSNPAPGWGQPGFPGRQFSGRPTRTKNFLEKIIERFQPGPVEDPPDANPFHSDPADPQEFTQEENVPGDGAPQEEPVPFDTPAPATPLSPSIQEFFERWRRRAYSSVQIPRDEEALDEVPAEMLDWRREFPRTRKRKRRRLKAAPKTGNLRRKRNRAR